MNGRRTIAVFVLSLLLTGPARAAFECPRPELSGPGVISQTPQEQQALGTMLTGSDAENHLGVAVADLQKRYPGVSDSEIVNYLLGAYCPVVAGMPGLSDAQRTGKVEQFAATLFRLVGAEAVISLSV